MKTISRALAVALLSTGAAAADLPARKAAPDFAPPPTFLFEGFYIGAQIGGAGFCDRARSLFAPNNSVLTSSISHGDSLIGGAHAGYDLHSGALAFGVVADFSGAKARSYNTAALFGYGVQNTVGVQGSLRGRVGYLVFDRTLLYVTGGLNAASLQHAYQSAIAYQSFDHGIIDATVGAGADYAFDQHWRAHLEYRAFGAQTHVEAYNFAQPLLATRHQQGESMITTGVSYRFGQ